jgi:monovalent cation:H+ antiporter-2, CPA2 family
MPHHTPLIATIVIGLSLAFLLGAVAQRLRVSPIAGYLVAGILIGPYTPGFVADIALAIELAEIGVILLMFGVGLHFSLKDLLSVRAIAIPGAVAQMAVASLLGLGLATYLGWSIGSGIVFGLALSVASTVVLLRALQERRLVNSDRGRVAVGWLIVEDMVMVLVLVLLPAVAPLFDGTIQRTAAFGLGSGAVVATVLTTIGKVVAFVAIMLVIGRRVIPAVLHYAAHSGSRELFRLCVLAIALGIAFGAAKLFGVSFALGAFFAGMILSESELSQRAAEETLPLRDAFAVLFFVSVGMLFNPAILYEQTWIVLATVGIIVIGKSLAAFAIIMAFGYSLSTALFISASLAQIGEFSFILASLGTNLGILEFSGRDLILAGALLSILLNPLLFLGLDRLKPWLDGREALSEPQKDTSPSGGARGPAPASKPNGTVILVGYGRVGKKIGAEIDRPLLHVLDEREEVVNRLREKGIKATSGSAPSALAALDLPGAQALVIAIPDVFEAGQIVEQARAANPQLLIIARGHSDAEADHLTNCGASAVVLGAEEIAHAIVERYREHVGRA